MFNSIQEQLEIVFKIDKSDKNYKNTNNLESKLSFISVHHLKNSQLIILLDSIDQLSKENYNLNWLLTRLPKNVKIVLSVLSNYENISDAVITE